MIKAEENPLIFWYAPVSIQESQKLSFCSSSPSKQETPAANRSCVCTGQSDQAKRAQRMQSSINIISAAQAVVDSLSKDKQQTSQSLSRVEISSIFHPGNAELKLPPDMWTVHLTINGWRLTRTDLTLQTTPGMLSLQSIITITIPRQTCPLKDHFQWSIPSKEALSPGNHPEPSAPLQGMRSRICLSMGCHRGDFHIWAVRGIHLNQSRLVNLLLILLRDFQKAEESDKFICKCSLTLGQALPTETWKTRSIGLGLVC